MIAAPEILSLALALLHFSFSLAYYWYVRARLLKKSLEPKSLTLGYRPEITTIMLAYNGRDRQGIVVDFGG